MEFDEDEVLFHCDECGGHFGLDDLNEIGPYGLGSPCMCDDEDDDEDEEFEEDE